jgi:hypothetical protein
LRDDAQSWGCEDVGGTESAKPKINLDLRCHKTSAVEKPTMDKLRKEAREALQRDPNNLPTYLPAAWAAAENNLHQLWQNISAHDSSTNLDVSLRAFYNDTMLTSKLDL